MKKIIAIGLIATMGLSLAGCAFGSKFNDKKIEKFLLEEYEAEEEDVDDVIEWIEDDNYKKFKDPVYFVTDDDDFDEVFGENMDLADIIAEPSKVVESKNVIQINDGRDTSGIIFLYINFKDEKNASNFLEDTVDYWDDEFCDECKNWAIADEEENALFGMFEEYNETLLVSMYQEKNYVACVIEINDDDFTGEFAEFFKLTDPVDDLKDGMKDAKKDKKDKDDDEDEDD